MPRTSVIIPVYQEERILRARAGFFSALAGRAELIFVDGGSADRSAGLAGRYGRVLACPRGRGRQKNAGAAAAVGDYLLFLHVDTQFDLEDILALEGRLAREDVLACFHLRVDHPRWFFRVFEAVVNARARRRGIVDGDLGMGVRRATFARLGGFADLPYMEDIEFSRRARGRVPVRMLDRVITVSSRKWDERGFIRTLGEYAAAYVRLWFGRLG